MKDFPRTQGLMIKIKNFSNASFEVENPCFYQPMGLHDRSQSIWFRQVTVKISVWDSQVTNSLRSEKNLAIGTWNILTTQIFDIFINILFVNVLDGPINDMSALTPLMPKPEYSGMTGSTPCMPVDVLVPCIARSSTAMVLTLFLIKNTLSITCTLLVLRSKMWIFLCYLKKSVHFKPRDKVRHWIGAVKKHDITWSHVHQNPWCHLVSLDNNFLTFFFQKLR